MPLRGEAEAQAPQPHGQLFTYSQGAMHYTWHTSSAGMLEHIHHPQHTLINT